MRDSSEGVFPHPVCPTVCAQCLVKPPGFLQDDSQVHFDLGARWRKLQHRLQSNDRTVEVVQVLPYQRQVKPRLGACGRQNHGTGQLELRIGQMAAGLQGETQCVRRFRAIWQQGSGAGMVDQCRLMVADGARRVSGDEKGRTMIGS